MLVGFLLAGAVGISLFIWPARSRSTAAWDSLDLRFASDSVTLVLRWKLEDDGGGPADSFGVQVWAHSPGASSNPFTARRIVYSSIDSLQIPGLADSLNLTLTIQAFRQQRISLPSSSAWAYPYQAGFSKPISDSANPSRMVLDLPPVSFSTQARSRPQPPPPVDRAPPVATSPAPGPRTDPAPAASVPGTCANEPPGFRSITGGPWEEVPRQFRNRRDNDSWVIESRPERFSLVVDPTTPTSDKRALEGRFPKGHPGGRGPFKLTRRFPREVSAVYMCVVQKLSDNFNNNGNTGTKFAFLLTPYQGRPQGLNHYFNLANRLGINLQSFGAGLNRNLRSDYNMLQSRGQWIRIEWLVIGNSNGAANGVARIWVNGNAVLNQSDVRYFFPSQAPAFTGVTWNPTYGGGSNPVPEDMSQRISEWYISGR